ncbi:hexokinase type 2-like isoform X2 [Bacillus rossius redtenbacheri]|uniref:hexokinase type 2-like isoform X2 n=2 Tax=Bacillus rossius redtenbacheri TaxID=93214 RepID=UPI002FDCED31
MSNRNEERNSQETAAPTPQRQPASMSANGRLPHPLDAAVSVAPLQLDDAWRAEQVTRVLQGLYLSGETVLRIQEVFLSELEAGIHQRPSSLQMENTYIPELPDHTEEGRYLALDLGGTNFRVLLMELAGGSVVREVVRHYHVDEQQRVGCGARLFDYLAACVAAFVRENNLAEEPLPLGFTFSFPMRQRALDVGELITWTKSFNCPSVVGCEVVRLLQAALDRRGDTRVQVVAILNDTTGTLVQGAVLDPRTAIGLILGTGSNACYMEQAERVQHWETQRHDEKEVVIDIEWGAFGDNGVLDFIKTDFDRAVDDNSLIVNSFTFEKYIGGKYMGEIVRVILARLAKEGLLFDGDAGETLLTKHAFTTSYVSAIEQDTVDGGSENTAQVLAKLGVTFSASDVAVVKHVCDAVSSRAAMLVAVCLAVLLNRLNRPDVTIAVDGSLFKFHPRLETLISKFIKLLAPGKKFQLMLAEDGSGKGAGLVAAIAMKLRKRLQKA